MFQNFKYFTSILLTPPNYSSDKIFIITGRNTFQILLYSNIQCLSKEQEFYRPSPSATRLGSYWSVPAPKSDATISSLVFQRFYFLADGIARPVWVLVLQSL